MTLTILHVSDVHFGDDGQGDQPRITKALAQAACKLASTQDGEAWIPDVCIFTGDLASTAKPEQFEAGGSWLLDMAVSPATRFFVVPGNHDIDRELVPLKSKGAHERTAYLDARPSLSKHHPHLAPFQQWHAGFRDRSKNPVLSDWKDPFGCSAVVTTADGMDVHLIGLNTAMLSRGDKDHRHLVQDVLKLNTMLDQRQRPDHCTIAIGHHPLSWLAKWNAAQVGKILGQATGANLYLHGHRHNQFAKSIANSRGQSMTFLEGGAAYHGAKYARYFSFYRLDFETREIWFKVYLFSEQAGEWMLSELHSLPIVASIPQLRPGRLSAQPEARPAPSAAAPKKQPPPAQGAPSRVAPGPDQVELSVRRRREDAEIAARLMLGILVQLDMSPDTLFKFEHRIKTVESAVRKVIARLESNPSYAVEDVSDFAGFRLVTHFQSGVPEIVEKLLRGPGNGVSGRPSMRPNPVHGVTIHTSRRENDPLSIVGAVREAVQRSCEECAIEVRSSATAYSSVHIVVDIDIAPRGGPPKWMPVEFQVRNVLEQIWGELDHKFRYGDGRGNVGSSSWQLHLNVLKAHFDTCTQYLDLIKKLADADTTGGAKVELSSGTSISRPELVLEVCKSLPPHLLDGLRRAFELWKQADASREVGGKPGLFLRAADAFELLLDLPLDMPDSSVTPEDFHYIIRMEQAYMLLMAGDDGNSAKAERIYRDIVSKRPEDPAATFRLGHSLRKLRKLDEAIAEFKRALVIARQPDTREFYDKEKEFVIDHARLSLGLSYYRQFEQAKTMLEKRRLIRLAIEWARDAYDHHGSSDIRTWARNDLLYYLWAQRELVPSMEEGEAGMSDQEFRDFATALEREQKAAPFGSYEYDDTLMRVHLMLGNKADALTAAARVRDWLERAAENRTGESLNGSTDRYGDEWYAAVRNALVSADERDALATAHETLAGPREE